MLGIMRAAKKRLKKKTRMALAIKLYLNGRGEIMEGKDGVG
jgi:hypothetical protein